MIKGQAMVKWIKACIVIALTADAVFATVRRVPSEYPTIQAAIDACDDGDAVLVSPGTYSGIGNHSIGILSSITLKSEQGPLSSIIDCQGSSHNPAGGFVIRDKDNKLTSIIDGFTIINAYRTGIAGGAILCWSNCQIRNCIITGNTSRSRAGGILVSGRDSNVTITNCLITGNQCLGDESFGGGVYCGDFGSQVILRNCVIAGNQAAYGGGVACEEGAARLENCIVTGNRAHTGMGNQLYVGNGGEGCTIIGCPTGSIAFLNSCFEEEITAIWLDYEGGWGRVGYTVDFHGLGNIATDPDFAIPGYWDSNGTPSDPNDDVWVDGDYHLKSQAGRWDNATESWVQNDITSPCIDAGHPNIPIGNEPFPNGGIINIGAYGGTVEASKSYFGTEPCDTIMTGDINGDCNVDFTDIELLLFHWLWDGEPYEPEPIAHEVYNPPNTTEPNDPGGSIR